MTTRDEDVQAVDAALAAANARIASLEREIAELKRVPDGGAMDRAVAAEARLAKCEMARLGCDAPCNPQEDE